MKQDFDSRFAGRCSTPRRAVIYTHDMEPITVVQLSGWCWDYLWEHLILRLPVVRPISPLAPIETPVFHEPPFDPIVELRAERLIRNGVEHLMLFTVDEEWALALKADFLPGQRAELRDREMSAFARGVLRALVDFLPPE